MWEAISAVGDGQLPVRRRRLISSPIFLLKPKRQPCVTPTMPVCRLGANSDKSPTVHLRSDGERGRGEISACGAVSVDEPFPFAASEAYWCSSMMVRIPGSVLMRLSRSSASSLVGTPGSSWRSRARSLEAEEIESRAEKSVWVTLLGQFYPASEVGALACSLP